MQTAPSPPDPHSPLPIEASSATPSLFQLMVHTSCILAGIGVFLSQRHAFLAVPLFVVGRYVLLTKDERTLAHKRYKEPLTGSQVILYLSPLACAIALIILLRTTGIWASLPDINITLLKWFIALVIVAMLIRSWWRWLRSPPNTLHQ